MMETMIKYIAELPMWIHALTAFITGCTAITMLTPTQVDDKVVNFILKVLNICAGNFGKNTNYDEEE